MSAAAVPIQAQHPTRPAFLGLAAALFGAALFEAVSHGSWGAFVAGLVAPDLALLLGSGRDLAKGQLHPRAVPVYNAVHLFWGPAGLAGAPVVLPRPAAVRPGPPRGTPLGRARGARDPRRRPDALRP